VAHGAVSFSFAPQYERRATFLGGGAGGSTSVWRLNAESVAPKAASFTPIADLHVKRTALALLRVTRPGSLKIAFVPTVTPAKSETHFTQADR